MVDSSKGWEGLFSGVKVKIGGKESKCMCMNVLLC